MVNVSKIEVNVGKIGHITNCYLVYDDNKNGILIDPGYESNKIIEEINRKNLKVKYIVITHAHADHMGALSEVQKYTNADIFVHKNDLDMLLEKEENYESDLNVEKQNINEKLVKTVEEGDILSLGEIEFEIIHTPGHTSGSICLFEKTSKMLFTGDTIFHDCYGRCDLYSSDFNDMVNSLKKVFTRFDDEFIYPGHGESVNLKKAKRYIKMLMAMKNVEI